MWIYLSPHLDDAVYSCGGRINAQVGAGETVAIWTVFAGDPPPGPLSKFARITLERSGAAASVEDRRAEDRRSCARLGAAFRHLDFVDALYRKADVEGMRQALYTSPAMLTGSPLPHDGKMLREIVALLLRDLPDDAVLVCPLGLGNHVDHRLVRTAAEEVNRRRQAAGNPLAALWYYLDLPYTLRPDAVNDKLLKGRWTADRRNLRAADIEAWQAAILDHASQLQQLWGDADAMRRTIEADVAKQGGAVLCRQGKAFVEQPTAGARPPRVLLLPHQRGRISPLRPMGGGPTSFFDLAASLHKAGCEVTFAAVLDEGRNFELGGVRYHHVAENELLAKHLSLLSDRSFDLVLSQRADALLLAKGYFPQAVALLRVIHTQLEDRPNVAQVINLHIDGVVAVSFFVKNLLVDLGVVENKIEVAYEGLTPGVFRPLTSVRREDNLVLFVGATVGPKGFDILLQAMELLQAEGFSARLEVHGSAAIWSGFSDKADWERLQSQHTFLDYRGVSDQECLVEAYNRATICVVPTDPARLQEGLGRVSLEAQACGCPVLVSRSGGLPETVVEGKTGVVVDSLTPAKLAADIKKALSDRPALQAMSVAAAQHARQSTMDHVAAGILKIAARTWEQDGLVRLPNDGMAS